MKNVRYFMQFLRPLTACFLLAVLGIGQVAAQVCNVASTINASGVINTFYPGPAAGGVAAGLTIPVGAARNISGVTPAVAVGDLVMIIQMQDATINSSATANYGSNTGTRRGFLALNQTGNYEFRTITAVGPGTFTVGVALTNVYTQSAPVAGAVAGGGRGQRTYQVVRIPVSHTFNVVGTLTSLQWNGTTGGIVAIEGASVVNFGAGINVDTQGFRGGGGHQSQRQFGAGTDPCGAGNNQLCAAESRAAAAGTITGGAGGPAAKAEGFAGTPRLIDNRFQFVVLSDYLTEDLNTSGRWVGPMGATLQGYPFNTAAGDFGRGAPGNAGGGANDHDAGGGGGASFGDGGFGGGRYNDGADWGGYGGVGTGIVNRLVLGGGGGASHGFHPYATGSSNYLYSGGNGGGIIYVRATVFNGGVSFTANGEIGGGVYGPGYIPVNLTNPRGLGGSGGGGGGSLLLISGSSLTSFSLGARGGAGGNAGHVTDTSTNTAGVGGGGGGGYIRQFATAYAPADVSAGAVGVVVSTEGSANNNPNANNLPGSGGTGGFIEGPALPPPPACTVADLAITKTDGVAAVPVGSTLTYTIDVSNAGPTEATGATVVDTFQPGTFVSTNWTCAVIANGIGAGTTSCPAAGAGNINTNLVNLRNGGQVRFTVTAVLNPAFAGTVTNTATVQPPAGLSDPGFFAGVFSGNNTSTDTTQVGDLRGYKSVRLSTDQGFAGVLDIGDTVTWSVFYTNIGVVNINNFMATDTIPAGFVRVPGVPGNPLPTTTAGACAFAGNGAAWTGVAGVGSNLFNAVGVLQPGCTVRIDIPMTTIATGTLANQAGGSGTGVSNTLSDNIDNSTGGLPAGVVPPAGSIAQTQNALTTDPTRITVIAPPPAVKSVRIFTDNAPAGTINSGATPDVMEYTIIYRNTTGGPIAGFNPTDALRPTNAFPQRVIFVPASLAVNYVGPGAPGAAASATFNGDGNVAATQNLFTAAVAFPAGGTFTITFRVTIAATTCGGFGNQSNGGIALGLTDSADNTTNSLGIPAGSVSQTPFGVTGSTDLTWFNVICPPAVKSVQFITDNVPNAQPAPQASFNPNGGVGVQGDRLQYTIIYRNNTGATITNFQITDPLPPGLTYVPGSIAAFEGGTTAPSLAANPAFNGTSNTTALASVIDLPHGGTVTVQFWADLNALACGNVTNQATGVGLGLTDTADNVNNSVGIPVPSILQTGFHTAGATDPTGVTVPCADLRVTKTDGVAQVNQGATLTYTIVVTNLGPTASGANTRITDTFPGGFTGGLSWTCVAAGGAVCQVAGPSGGNIAHNATASMPSGSTLTYTVTAPLAAATSGTILNTATVALPVGSTLNDPPANNTDTDTTVVSPLRIYKSVRVSTDVSPVGPSQGDTLIWSIFVHNIGAAALTGFNVADTLPAGLTLAGGAADDPVVTLTNGTAATCTTGLGAVSPLLTINAAWNGAGSLDMWTAGRTLGPGCTFRIDLTTTVTPTFVGGTIANQAIARYTGPAAAVGLNSDNIDNATVGLPAGVVPIAGSVVQTQGTDVDPTTVSIPVLPRAVKSIHIQTDTAPLGQVNSGDRLLFTIIYRNTTAAAIANFNIRDVLPLGGIYVAGSGTAVAGGGAPAVTFNATYDGGALSNVLTAPIALNVGGTVTVSLQVDVIANTCGILSNQAEQVGGAQLGLTDSADNLQNAVGIPAVPPAISQAPFGTAGATDPTRALAICAPAVKGVKIVTDTAPAGASPNDVLQYTIIYRNNTAAAIANFQVTDTLPASVTYVGGTLNVVPGGTLGAALPNAAYTGLVANNQLLQVVPSFPVGGSITATFQARISATPTCGNVLNQANGTTVGLSDNADGSGTNNSQGFDNTYVLQAPFGTAGATDQTGVTINCPPTLTKSVNPVSVPVSGTTRLTITLGNANAAAITLNAILTDPLPTGFRVAAVPNIGTGVGQCTLASIGAAANATSVTYANGASIPAGGCTIQVDITNNASTAAAIANGTGLYTNTIGAGALSTSNGSNLNPATADIGVIGGHKSVRLFTDVDASGVGTITVGDIVEWSVFYTNPAGAAAIANFQATDTIGAGQTYVATSINGSATLSPGGCSAVTANTGFTGAGPNTNLFTAPFTFNPGCTVVVRYQTSITTGGAKDNQASATGAGLPTVLTDNIDITTTGLPAGVTTLGLLNSGTTPVQAQTQVAGTIAPTTLNAVARPTLAKAFNPATIPQSAVGGPDQGSSALTITLGNSNAVAITLSALFTDTLPAGLVVATPNGLATTCTLASVGAAAGGNTITYANTASIPAGGCTITVNVRSVADTDAAVTLATGLYTNSLAIGALSTSTGTNVAAATANLSVVGGHKSVRRFTDPDASLTNSVGDVLEWSVFYTNPGGTSGVTLNAFQVTDTLLDVTRQTIVPGSLAAAISGGAGCGAVPAVNAGFNGAGSNTLVTGVYNFPSGSMAPPGGCTVRFTYRTTITAGGAVTNQASATATGLAATLSDNVDNATAGLPGGVAGQINGVTMGDAVATPVAPQGTGVGVAFPQNQNALNVTGVTVAPPLILTKAYSVSPIGVGTNSILTFTITNPPTGNPARTGLAFLDTIALGNNLTITAVSAVAGVGCVGTVTISSATNPTRVSYAAGTVPASAAVASVCTFTATVRGDIVGNYPNVAANLSGVVGSFDTTGLSATLVVGPPPVLTKAYLPVTIAQAASSTLTFTVTNGAGNPAQTGQTFVDTLTLGAGLTISAVTQPTAGCGGTVNLVSATSPARLSWTGGSMTAGTAACTFTATVVGNTSGSYPNTNAGNISAGSGIDTSGVNSTLNVGAVDLQPTKTHVGNFSVGMTGTFTLTANNLLGTNPTVGSYTITDTLPAGLSFASATGTGWVCVNAAPVVTCTSSTVIAVGGTNPNPITLVVNVLGTAPNQVINSAVIAGGNEPAVNTGNNTVVDYVNIIRDGVSQFFPDGAQTAMPNSTVWYPHEFVSANTGNVVFNFSNLPSPVIPGWQQTLYRDTNCNGTLDPAENTALTNPTVAFPVVPGTRICLIVREFVPAGAGLGAQDTIRITATLTPAVGPVETFTRTDITTVGIPAALKLTKEVRNVTTAGPFGTNNTGLPGNTLQYRITYQNNGTQPLNMLVVNDATPMFTTYSAAACGALGMGLTACMVTTQPAPGATGPIIWNFTGALAPGASGIVTFDVIIAP